MSCRIPGLNIIIRERIAKYKSGVTDIMSAIFSNPAEEKEGQVNNTNHRISYSDMCAIDKRAADSESLNAIKNYTSSSNKINSYELSLSLGIPLEDDNIIKQEENNCAALRHYLDTGQLLIDMVLFRGSSMDSFCSRLIDSVDFFRDCMNLSDKELNNKYETKIFTYGQFLSTSVDYDSACEFISFPNPCMLRIYAPKGTACRCIESISEQPAEHEVTLTSNTKFQLKRIQTEADGMKTIFLTVIISQNEENDSDTANGCDSFNC